MRHLDTHRRLQLGFSELCRCALLFGVVATLVVTLPNDVYSVENGGLILTLGALALWRFTWWAVHVVRAEIYGRFYFPRLRQRCEELWSSGWRPRRVFYMMTTFREVPVTTERLVRSVIDECRATGIPARVFFGTSEASDEEVITRFLHHYGEGVDVEVVFVRQNLPGKRIAIGLALRAMSRYGVDEDDVCVFMDGDTYMHPGMLRKCLPVFELLPEVDGLTTDEDAVINGPRWMQWWTDMRMAQRHLAMQSIALSGKLLTLTGRCSFFRARDVVEERFIRLVEADHLDHWLWGRFRFLSGDDKSTVYALLSRPQGAALLYVPDARATTTEYVEGGGFPRMRQNLLRWSGNLLRNGRRCIALGPQQLGWFTWWCFVDQRIAIWTTLVGPVIALSLAAVSGLKMLWAAVVLVLVTRLLLSVVLWYYGGRVNVSFPFLLYFNQITNATVKVYMWFRLAKQRWRNRGDQRVAESRGWLPAYQNLMGAYLTALTVGGFVFVLWMAFIGPGVPRLALVRHVFGL